MDYQTLDEIWRKNPANKKLFVLLENKTMWQVVDRSPYGYLLRSGNGMTMHISSLGKKRLWLLIEDKKT